MDLLSSYRQNRTEKASSAFPWPMAITGGAVLVFLLVLFYFFTTSPKLQPEEKKFLEQGKSTEQYDKKLFRQ